MATTMTGRDRAYQSLMEEEQSNQAKITLMDAEVDWGLSGPTEKSGDMLPKVALGAALIGFIWWVRK